MAFVLPKVLTRNIDGLKNNNNFSKSLLFNKEIITVKNLLYEIGTTVCEITVVILRMTHLTRNSLDDWF